MLTLTSQQAAEAPLVQHTKHVVRLHYEHWAQFTEGADTLRAAFGLARVS